MSTKLGMCIHLNIRMIHVKGGHAPGSFWAKILEEIAILSLWTQLLLEFSSDIYQTWSMHSPKHKNKTCVHVEGVHRRGSFWV